MSAVPLDAMVGGSALSSAGGDRGGTSGGGSGGSGGSGGRRGRWRGGSDRAVHEGGGGGAAVADTHARCAGRAAEEFCHDGAGAALFGGGKRGA